MYLPITEKFLRENWYGALFFAEGIFFFRVLTRQFSRYSPYKLLSKAGTAQEITASTHQGELLLLDPRSTEDELLYLENYTDGAGFPHLYHCGIGIRPHGLRMYQRLPETQEIIGGKFDGLNPVAPNANEDLAYITSEDSPFDNPTEASEFILLPKTRTSFEFYNNETCVVRPVLNVMAMKYCIQPLNNITHSNLITQIARGQRPASLFRVGYSNKPIAADAALQKAWNMELFKNMDAAIRLGGR